MVQRRNVDQSSPHPSLTSNPVQVLAQNGDIQEMDEDNAQKKVQFYFHNCTVHLGSSDTNNVTIRDSGNNIPQVICSSLLSPLTTSSCNSAMSYYSDNHSRIIGRNKSSEVLHLQPPAVCNNGKSEHTTIFPNCILTILVTTTSTDSPLHNGRIHNYLPVDHFPLLCVAFAILFCLVFSVTLPQLCGIGRMM